MPSSTVLAEDARFRNLPVVLTSDELAPAYDLPNLEIIAGEPAHVAANALPLIRQHALEAHFSRTLRSIDAGGLLDPRTGLLTPAAFNRDFATAVYQTLSRGGGLSVARFAFDPAHPRAQLDGARIISRLMRQMDFGAAQDDGSVIVAFAETDLRTAHMIARRLSSVMRHTTHGKRDARSEPAVTLATMLPSDSAKSLLARLHTANPAAPRRECSDTSVCGTTVLSSHCRSCQQFCNWRTTMKKIALIAASLALLATPAFAEDAKTTGTAPAEAKFSTVSKGRNVQFEAEGPERL